MANQPKKYKKFVATAATATLVASAIVPVASAADVKFSDVKDSSEFAPFIYDLVEKEIIKGYEDGTFKPGATLERKNAVVMVGRFLEANGFEIPADAATNLRFDDISVNQTEVLNYASLLADLGVINTGGNFNPAGTLTRSQMAKIIVEAYGQILGGVDLTELVADYETGFSDIANASTLDYIKVLEKYGIATKLDKFNPNKAITRAQIAKFLSITIASEELQKDAAGLVEGGEKPVDPSTPDTGDVTPAISSVKALSKSKVEVSLNVAVDEVAKENFTIAGGSVNGVELSADKKTAVLEVSGLAYATKYTVAVKDVKVEGEAVDFGSKEFTTPAVTEEYTLEVTPAATTVTANGADNTVIKFELLGADGKVDTNADNMVLELATTFGNLATNRVTVQDGVGQVVLSSEFSTKEVVAKVSAQIIEASTDYKDLIGKVAGEASVTFSPSAVTTDPNAVTFQDAESNQADRVVLYFDKAVSTATFVKTNTDGTFQTDVSKTKQILKSNVEINISQDGIKREVVGIIPVEGNDKAVEVLLDKNETLKDNAQVNLDVKIGTTRNQRTFTLTDARQPEFTGVTATNLRTLDLQFSEAIDQGNFSIDGRWTEAAGDFTVTFGEFDAVNGVDKRDTAKLTLNKDDNNKQLYFAAGLHSVTVTQLKDFAADKGGDKANVSTTQTLNFTVAADTTAPIATSKVESPEQIRLTFNKDVVVVDSNGAALTTSADLAQIESIFNQAFKVYDEKAKKWVSGTELYNFSDNKFQDWSFLTVDVIETENSQNEFVVELNRDWTEILTNETDTYHNYKFKFEFEEKTFESLTNGIQNAKFELDLNYSGSPLNQADNTSPVIDDIVQTDDTDIYEITMSEPVKLPYLQQGTYNEQETLSVQQNTGLPKVLAEFQGKNKEGKAVVVEAEVIGYSSVDGSDTKFTVRTKDGYNLQSLVNQGYDSNWKVVVRSISDDIGNTAATLTEDFVVASTTTATGFEIMSSENGYTNKVFAINNSTKDVIEVTFTKGVNVAGADNLTSVYNWTLNGTKLSNLSNVESIKVENVYGDEKDGYEKVIITFADDRAFGNTSNVISVTKGITSLDGTVLSGEYEVVAQTFESAIFNKTVALSAVANTKVVDTGLNTYLVAFKASDVEATFGKGVTNLKVTVDGADYPLEVKTANGVSVLSVEIPKSAYDRAASIKVELNK